MWDELANCTNHGIRWNAFSRRVCYRTHDRLMIGCWNKQLLHVQTTIRQIWHEIVRLTPHIAPVTNHSCVISRSSFWLKGNKEHLSLQSHQLALRSDDQKAAAESVQCICEQDEPPYLGCSLHALTWGLAKEAAHCLLSPNTVSSRFCQQHQ